MDRGETEQKKLKIVYAGYDLFLVCLKRLAECCDILYLFTFPGDDYDSSEQITAFAAEQGIPCSDRRLSAEKLLELEELGADYMIVAGYIWKIPVSERIRQINIHPAYLPMGRGPWPMPVALMRGLDSGVTFHRLVEELDEGDILLQRKISFDSSDDLELLTAKIRRAALELLEAFLEDPDTCWEQAVSQDTLIRRRCLEEPLYWKEPSEEEYTIHAFDTPEVVERKMKAFRGFGVRYCYEGLRLIVEEGYPDQEGVLIPTVMQPDFREIRLSDRETCETLRRRYPALLSDYTFSLVYSWRKQLDIRVYQDEDLMVFRIGDRYLFPLGSEEKVHRFIDSMIRLQMPLYFGFCDENQKEWLERAYPGLFSIECPEKDRDYRISIRDLLELPGGKRISRRKDAHHFAHLDPPPVWERIDQDNLPVAAALSLEANGPDLTAEQEAIRHFFELGLKGTLVKRGDRYIGFSIVSDQNEHTLQGHFLKCLDRERGGYLYMMQTCAKAFGTDNGYMNLEDDMGYEGLRRFKMSLKPEIVLSYNADTSFPEVLPGSPV